ncbi:hypothetical protein VNO77_03335 [Canavalia gladiata]|uniref:Uncharacterized protein n=1 Tax=Canavalia gladiata TaxID=3824 RepID=A0AAN9MUJ4_CANGL
MKGELRGGLLFFFLDLGEIGSSFSLSREKSELSFFGSLITPSQRCWWIHSWRSASLDDHSLGQKQLCSSRGRKRSHTFGRSFQPSFPEFSPASQSFK